MAETIRTNLVVTSLATSQTVAQVDLMTVTMVETVDDPEVVPAARPEMDLVALPVVTRTLLVTVTTVVTRKETACSRRTLLVPD